MATTLSLFPARVRFVNDDGTLTNEAYRALQIVFGRVGGALGDNGADVFANQMIFGQASGDASTTDTTTQQASPDRLMADVIQQAQAPDLVWPDLMQTPGVMTPTASGGAAPAGGTGTAAGGWDTAGHRDSAITLLNNIRTCLINNGLMT